MPHAKTKAANASGQHSSVAQPAPTPFGEASAWKSVGSGWRPLFGSYRDLGFSFEWHEFTAKEEFNWGQSFHPGSLEVCLNLSGAAKVSDARHTTEMSAQTAAFYYQGKPPLVAIRRSGEEHRFITIEFSPAFLGEYFQSRSENLHPLVRALVNGVVLDSTVVSANRLAITLHQVVESLRHCPVFAPAKEMWFRSKALEVAAHLFFSPASGELLCTRTQRLAQERVEKAKLILRAQMQNPPPLEELARMVNCSSFYLSRQFAKEGGMTMQQFLRQIRMERAAELLRTGKCNVTEAALEVGYNSLSHFSSTFHETFGCCPGLYPLRTEPQQLVRSEKAGK